MPAPGAGTQTSLDGSVAALSARLQWRNGQQRPRRGATPGKGAPILSYSYGGSNQPDLTEFADVFQPSGGLFAPGYPLVPVEPEQTRSWDFPVGYNYIYTPRSYEPVSFAQLRALAENHDITRLAIETRKDQVESLDWQIKSCDSKKPKAGADARAKTLTEFWRKPDGYHSFETWLRLLLEDVFVPDAATLEVRYNRGGDIIALDQVDGSTIKVLLDDTGRRPAPPAPAYEQIIHGRPWVLLPDGQRAYTEEQGKPLSERELIYMPRNPRIHKGYGFCYSSDVEILTRRGWLNFSEVTLSDQVATRNMGTKTFEWQSPNHMTAEAYNGPMIHFHSTSVDLLVTPQHRMLVTATPQGLVPRRSRQEITQRDCENRRRRLAGVSILTGRRSNARGENVISAAELAARLNPMIKIPMTSTWIGESVQEKVFDLPMGVEVEATRRKYRADGSRRVYIRTRVYGTQRAIRMTGDDYCSLLGAYLAEGNMRSQGGIEINQRETSKGFAAYASLIARVVNGPAQHNGQAFVLAHGCLNSHFSQFGRAHEKFIPDEIMNATPVQIRLFWDHFVLGDGCFEARPNVSGRGKRPGQPGTRITTVSKRISDQLMELAQKLGWSASVRKRRIAGKMLICGNECNVRDSYVVTVRYSDAMGVKATETSYAGTIHCVTVPNGIVYVRRNGKPAWCGNSPVEQILTTVNIGLRRQVKQLRHFSDGNIPAGLINGPEGWSSDQLQRHQVWFDSILQGNLGRQTQLIWGPAGSKYTPFTEEPYKDSFDEWLARIVCFAFSLPPTAFTPQVNRATAETAQDVARSEGLAPILGWVKRLVDHVIQERQGQPDLEFAWQQERELDADTQSKVLIGYAKEGIFTRNEARDQLGMDKVEGGDDLMVDTPNGPMLLSDVAAASALIANPPPPPPPTMPRSDTEPGGGVSGGKPPAQGKSPATGGPGKKPAPAKGKAPAQNAPKPKTAKAAAKTLYVSRRLKNTADLRSWAKAQGFKSTLKPKDLHVTIAYSKEPLDWDDVGDSFDEIRVPPDSTRTIEPLGDKGAVVLRFQATDLAKRWQQIKDAGASWDFPSYKPHISISYEGSPSDLANVEPYSGELIFGPERFAEIKDDWDEGIEEQQFAAKMDLQARLRKAGGLGSGAIDPANARPIDLPVASDEQRAEVDHVAWQRVQSPDFALVERIVPLADIVATQDEVDGERVDRHAQIYQQEGRFHRAPVVLELDGSLYIVDGHHRCEAVKQLGGTSLVVSFVEGDEQSPAVDLNQLEQALAPLAA